MRHPIRTMLLSLARSRLFAGGRWADWYFGRVSRRNAPWANPGLHRRDQRGRYR